MHEASLGYVHKLDMQDDLKEFRSKFRFPEHNGKKQIYFLGNSLGLQPVTTAGYINKVLDQWQAEGVESFFRGNDPWMDYHDHLTRPLAGILGALPEEITVMNQLTVNLHLMLISFYRPQGKRTKIICEAKAFPSDQYMLETHVKHYGFDPGSTIIEVQPKSGQYLIEEEDILAAIDKHRDELALVLWGGVNYYTGQVFNIKAIAKAAHDAGAKAGFDLAHAAGNISLNLHDWNVDFACWCNYKYLNGGPGTVGGAFIHQRYHNDSSISRFAGWWGYEKSTRFLMEKEFVPVKSAEGWQLSTPSPILHACLRASLDIFDEAGWHKIQEKKKLLNDWCWFLLEHLIEESPGDNIEFLTTPRGEGSQVSILVKRNGKSIFESLGAHGIMSDWREPDVIRIAPVPLYNSFEDVWHFYEVFRSMMK
ncbi:kynureninase [Pollutibacter soli]|uniref:kynureninase n=1 Tax=Pollutibacter soli TaxID=3034157 RepID=UPI003013F0B8